MPTFGLCSALCLKIIELEVERRAVAHLSNVLNALAVLLLLQCCFMSTEARWLIRDGDRGGRGRKSDGSAANTAQKRPERPWTAARTMEMLRRCPLAIAQ